MYLHVLVTEFLYFLRYDCFLELMKHIDKHEGGMKKFTKGYQFYGIHRLSNNSIIAREWAPGALGLYLKGDFSEWYLRNLNLVMKFYD